MNLPLKDYWELLSRHIRPQRTRFAAVAAFLLGSIALQVVSPQIIRGFIDAALAAEPARQLLVAAVAFIGIALMQQLIHVAFVYLGETVAWTATNALRAELSWHCLNLDMGWHADHTPGELIERIDGDATELSRFFSTFVVTLGGNLLLLVGILIALYLEDWRVGLAFTLYAILALLALNRVRDLAMPHQKARREAEAAFSGFLEEQLASTEDIRSSGAIDYSIRESLGHQAVILRHSRKASWMDWVIGLTVSVILTLGQILAVLSGYHLYTAGAITLGTVYLFVQYISLLEQPIWTLTHEIQGFQTVGACIERLSELRATVSKVNDGPGAPLPDGPLRLTFDHVAFAYEADEPVLRDLSLELQPGKVLGLLGRTGSGKTTLARLAFRLYDPSTGSICLDGCDLRQATQHELRRRVAYVTQDVQLFRASLRENLSFFDPTVTDTQITAALEELGLTEWLTGLPQGLDTLIEASGRSLSAGEAQLLAFTRVFLRDPGLVILDEASSRLDPATEQAIERAIDRLLENRTAIVIAHRLGTVHRADEILILEEGRSVEHGARATLASDPTSHFYQLLQTGLEEVLV